ncbi:uncharacterized protein PADG_11608 [Paracoccidioides brasiliensis Pb18]|uniref:Uncharacterized protein n=1 Tax=Paracoccidioides brasiliensis (strain Pb18) TaxID=502780 RepID=A0A0A0HYF8_PARBD|nr:uncharacterized protein PADG_11608 [Paracoccidioides brasiliensis Pb18]KGM92405.1 hypothetical protein PADG_11608 [Paracoccidioides brasiliensis Pb18]
MTERSETTPLLIDASAGASTANEQNDRPMWLFLNLAIDVFVSGYSFVIDIQGLLLNSKPCQPGPRCGEISKRTRMLAGIGLSLGLALG